MQKRTPARRLINPLVVCFTLVWLAALAAEGLSAELPSATLTIYVDESGKAQTHFAILRRAPLAPAQKQALDKALNIELKEWSSARRDAVEEEPDDVDGEGTSAPPAAGKPAKPAATNYYYIGEREMVIARRRGQFQAEVDLAAALAALRGIGVEQLRVSVIHPHAGYSECSKNTRDFPFPWSDADTDYHLYELSTESPALSLVRIAYGNSVGSLLKTLSPLIALIVVPVGLSFWTRRRLLQATGEVGVRRAFAATRLTAIEAMGLPLLWWLAVYWTRADKLLDPVRPARGSLANLPFSWAIMLLPPLVLVVVCLAIVQPALARQRDETWDRRKFARGAVAELVGGVLPWLMAIDGVLLLIGGDRAIGAAMLVGAYVLRLALGPARMKALGIEGYAVVLPKLRSRVFELAARAGVRLREVSVIPESSHRIINAFAVSDNRIFISEVFLKRMSRREVDAIIAHEIAHLKSRHSKIKSLTFILVLLLPSLFLIALAFLSRWAPQIIFFISSASTWVIVLSLVAGAGLQLYLSRRFEYAADRRGAQLTGDPEAMIRAQARLSQLSKTPMNWSRLDEKLFTHPSHMRRIQALAKTFAIAPEQLDAWLNDLDADPERYSLTAASDLPDGASAAPIPARPAAGAKKPAGMLTLYPIKFAAAGFLLAFFLSQYGSVRAWLAAGHIPPPAFMLAGAFAGAAFACRSLKRRLLHSSPNRLEFVAARAEDFPALDRNTLQRHTDALEALGFTRLTDYTTRGIGQNKLAGFGRLFAHTQHRCMAEVVQVMAGTISVTPMQCSVTSTLDDGTRLSSSNGEAKAVNYAYRLPKSLWISHPGASPEALLREHLHWRADVAAHFGAGVCEALSVESYFDAVRKYLKERRRVQLRKNMLVFLFEMDRFNRKPRQEWLGSYAKAATARGAVEAERARTL
jgi:heat shock protein HtpX